MFGYCQTQLICLLIQPFFKPVLSTKYQLDEMSESEIRYQKSIGYKSYITFGFGFQ
jgi:hypothetical protein